MRFHELRYSSPRLKLSYHTFCTSQHLHWRARRKSWNFCTNEPWKTSMQIVSAAARSFRESRAVPDFGDDEHALWSLLYKITKRFVVLWKFVFFISGFRWSNYHCRGAASRPEEGPGTSSWRTSLLNTRASAWYWIKRQNSHLICGDWNLYKRCTENQSTTTNCSF